VNGFVEFALWQDAPFGQKRDGLVAPLADQCVEARRLF
jgi:hypothetical protein